jgi:tetratricopeptide (TPR) repeat protein
MARQAAGELREMLPQQWSFAAPASLEAPAASKHAAPARVDAPAAEAVEASAAVPVAAPVAAAAAGVAPDGLADGRAALDAGRYQDALESLTTLAARHSEAGDVQYLLGQARRGLGDLDGAIEAFTRAVSLMPSADHRAALAAAELLDGRYAAAAGHFAEVSEAEPARVELTLGHVEALLGQGELDAAQARLGTLSEPQAAAPAARIVVARVALAQSRPVAAIEALSPLAKAGELDPAALALYADALYADDRVNQAAATYEASLAADPDNAEGLIGRAEVHLRAERPADALPMLRSAQEVLSRSPRGPALSARMFMLFGHAYLQRARPGDRESAGQALARAVTLPGAPAEAYFWLGEAQGGLHTPRATEAYLRYLQLAPAGRFAVRARRALGPLL